MEFKANSKGIFLHQRKYANDILKRFRMADCNPASSPAEPGLRLCRDDSEVTVDATLYKQIVGSLRYLCNTRPDLAFSVGLISRFMDQPSVSHLNAAKRVLIYVKGTADMGILFPSSSDNSSAEISGFTDSDWRGDKDDRKSTAGYLFMYGNAPVSWCSRKQNVVALSSCEAEYIAAALGACQAQWFDTLLGELKMGNGGAVKLFVDNKSTIDLAKHPVAHGRSKHIETKFYFLRDQVSKEKLLIEHCSSENQLADMLTKPLKIGRFKELRNKIGMVSLTCIN